jgi:phosphatidylethanolamine/phosphatidyl-N-methylethanolamine N-methyltransferase
MSLALRRIVMPLPWLSRICAKRENVVFFFRWLAAPLNVGSVVPSSQSLARAIASQIDLHSNQPIIELGGGTGSVTQGLLETGIDPARLIVVENDRRLCVLLRERFPKLCIVQGDASRLTDLLKPLGINSASCVVSSLPLLSLPKQIRDRIIRESLLLLSENGRFIQYTYGLGSPLADFNLYGQVTARIWRNFPPASVWRFQGI